MIEYYPWRQINEIKLCFRVGTLWHSENWVLLSKSVKSIANIRTFFLILWVDIPLEIRNPFLDLYQTRHISLSYKRKLYSSWESARNVHRNLVRWKIPRVCNLLDSSHNQLSRISRMVNKFVIEISWHTWSCNIGEVKKVKEGATMPFLGTFLTFLDPI